METISITKKATPFTGSPEPPELRDLLDISSIEGLCEYLLVLSPGGPLRDSIVNQKKYFTNNYENRAAVYGKPHITLANFLLREIAEDEIVRRLNFISENSHGIKVVLRDYNWFPEHTMYLNVLYPVNIQQLVRKISALTQSVIRKDNHHAPHFILNPHLTICKDLSAEQFEMSRIEYTTKTFSGEFTASEMLLLKRSIGINKYEEVGHFKFGLPVILDTTIQGKLFQ